MESYKLPKSIKKKAAMKKFKNKIKKYKAVEGPGMDDNTVEGGSEEYIKTESLPKGTKVFKKKKKKMSYGY